MLTGLLKVDEVSTWVAGGVRARRARLRPLAALALAAALAAAGGTVVAQEGDAAAVADDELVSRLAELEQQLAGIPLLPDVSVAEDTTWGTIAGDLVGTGIILDEVDEDLQQLVSDAGDADTPVADAVEDVAAAYRTLGEGYVFLAAFEQAGLGGVAVGADDEDGDDPEIVTGDDEPRGQAQAGLTLLLEALPGFSEGYAVLRDAEAAADARSLFEVRFGEVQQVAQTEAADVRALLSYEPTELLVDVSRFEPTVGGQDPARTVLYTCVDRDDYLKLRSEGAVLDLPVPEGDQADLPIPDCPALENGNEVRLVPPGTTAP